MARILIIDDDANLRRTLADILRLKGHEVQGAVDGTEGLARALEDPCDLLLLDLGLPDIPGLEVMTRVKQARPATEVILQTGNAALDSAIEATNRGAFSYLIKPCAIEQLLLQVRRACEKRQASEELQRVNDSLRTIFNSVNDAIFIHETSGEIIDVNEKMLEMYGVRREEAKSFSLIDDYSAPESHPERLPTMWRRAVSGEPCFFEWKARRPGDGSVFDVEVFLRQIALRDKIAILATVRDLSQCKATALALDQAYSELKATHAQMLQTEKMASIGQLAAGVAHEINNPLGFILSNLGTLDKYAERLVGFIQAQAETLDAPVEAAGRAQLEEKRRALKLDYVIDDIAQLIAESREGAERVKKIVRDLKSFSRVDEMEVKPVDLNDCLDSTLNIVWNELKYKAEVKRDYGNLPPVNCNSGQLNQVFMNLLVNAAHAIEKQGTITLSSACEADIVRITIADTGCGIPEEDRAKIFEPFFTTKDVGRGTGLGLSISYDIVKKHGGEILLASKVGKGSSFTVLLPAGERN